MSKKIFATLFLIILFINYYRMLDNYPMIDVIKDSDIINGLDANMANDILGNDYLKEIYGITNLALSPNEIINNSNSIIVKYDGGFILPLYNSDIKYDKYIGELQELNELCNAKGACFAYISLPEKTSYINPGLEYGFQSNAYDIRCNFLNDIKQRKIKVLDVGDIFKQKGIEEEDLFYKTDHHWKAIMGLNATRNIVEFVNDEFGVETDINLISDKALSISETKPFWLGETGRALSYSWIKNLDTIDQIKPIYDTSLVINSDRIGYTKQGDFSILIDETKYESNVDLYEYSAHYSYSVGIDSPTWIHNDNGNGRKLLLIKDSFAHVVAPFLALVFSDVVVWDMRITPDGLYDFIDENCFDVVLVAYTDYYMDNMYAFK